MKRTIVIILCILATNCIFAQPKRDIFIIGTSTIIPDNHIGVFDGFGRSYPTVKKYDKDTPIIFKLGNKEMNAEVCFFHFNFHNRQRPDLFVYDLNISDLNNFNAENIYVDEFFIGKTKEDIFKWMLDNSQHTNVWIVDKSLYYKSIPSLTQPDKIKIIQVKIDTKRIPSEYYSTYYSGN